ncbi:DegQ family serine endoprotease [Amantichitinum ursilacus]|uniref:Probable periplasmic serine endoprotease DegP-like n=1 Tax=Amantichitinum ursilacus TaxID=857265 RepID=A0A0N1JSK9_9NEIS|nr:DegQ family serine endoprotease [Amantichitinum ursilacus]KPC52937.1 putative periplasmic serine endoprotease DegP-like precursor [Amantichitinum ursilacus]
MTKPRTWKQSAIALGIAGLLGFTVAKFNGHLFPQAQATTPVAAATAPTAPIVPVVQGNLPNFSDIVQRNGPAVVNISVTGQVKTAQQQRGGPQIDPNDPFYEFFRRFGIPGAPQGGAAQPTHALGSGFIISADGIVLTNAHVVADASEVTVKLTDKREFVAKVLGFDKDTDIAVLKINAANLPTVKLGDPANSRVGDWVLAIGSPFGFENSVTAGIISAKSRSLPDGGYTPFIQTDAPINPGNSGGPLFNLNGEVIGINAQIYSRSGGFQGLSFSIPIDIAKNVEQQIVAHGKVTRGRLGVTIQDVNQSLAQSFGLKAPNGALVSGVEPDSAGAKAGLKSGDIILKLNDQPIISSSDLPPRIANITPGNNAKLEIWRDGKTQTLNAKITEAKGEKVAAADKTPDHGRLGLAVRPLSKDEQQESGIASGLVVEQASGPAAAAGIEPGDVVLAINGTPVTSAEQLKAFMAKAGDHVALLVQRGDAKIFVPINLG